MSYKQEDEYAAVFALTNLGGSDGSEELESVDVCEPSNSKFPLKLYDIMDNSKYHDIVHWLPQGKGFYFVDKKRFEIEVLPLFFKKRTKFTSFTRRLIRWGFTRVARGNLIGSYFHAKFQQEKRSLCIELCNGLRNKKIQLKRSCSKDDTSDLSTCTSEHPAHTDHPAPPVRRAPQDKHALMYAYYAHKDQELKRLFFLRMLEHKRQRLMLQEHIENVQNQYMHIANVQNQRRLLAFMSASTQIPDYPLQAVPLIGQPSLCDPSTLGNVCNPNTFGANAA